MIRELKHYNLYIFKHSETKMRVNGKEIDGAEDMYIRVLEGGAKCYSVGIVVMRKLGGVHQELEVCQLKVHND